jgi:hypothetical protein
LPVERYDRGETLSSYFAPPKLPRHAEITSFGPVNIDQNLDQLEQKMKSAKPEIEHQQQQLLEQPISRLGNWNQQLSLQLVFGSQTRIVQIILNAELGRRVTCSSDNVLKMRSNAIQMCE